MTSDRIADLILHLTAERGTGKSVSPEEVARAACEGGADWRRLLGAVRSAARRLAIAGRIDILRKGVPADPETVKGVVRLRARVPSPTDPD